MKKLMPALLAGFLSVAPGAPPQAQEKPQQPLPQSVTITLPDGPKTLDCNKLTPERKLTIKFLLQMHDHPDGYTEYMRKKNNQDLQAAAALIHHLTAHGVKKSEIEKAMKGCGVTNVQYSPTQP